jgi:DNA polymerase-3 subunit delta'
MDGQFWPVCGHGRILALLSHELASGSLRHAYLLSGPRHSGKSTIASAFAQAIVCTQQTGGGPGCGRCDGCRRAAKGIHPDIQTFSLETQRQRASERSGAASGDRLSIDTVREIIGAAAYRPFTAQRRVIIVDDVETMTGTAQEALLKTIEEPPLHLVLMLLSESADILKQTIRSRCELLSLLPVPAETIAICLRDRGTEKGAALELSAQAAGLPGRAIGMALDPRELEILKDSHTRATEWIAASPFQRVCRSLELAKDFGKTREQVFSELETVSELWRRVMMNSAGMAIPAPTLPNEADNLQPARQIELKESLRALESVMTCMSDLESNVRPRLALEAMVLQWPMIITEISS